MLLSRLLANHAANFGGKSFAFVNHQSWFHPRLGFRAHGLDQDTIGNVARARRHLA